MAQSYIRIARTPDVEKVLADLRSRFSLLNEAEIIKLALSEVHNKELQDRDRKQKLRERFYHAIEEGGKAGNKLLAKRGFKRGDLTEQEIYDLFLDTHKHKS